MPIATLTSKKQITIPNQIAQQWNLQKGDGLMFIEEDGVVKVFPIRRESLLGMRGCLKPKRPAKSIEELRGIAREEHASRHADPES